MRFRIDGPSIPDSLLEKCDAGRVVFFCGAGVSCYPSGSNLRLPNFRELTKLVIDHFKPSKKSDIVKAMKQLDENESVNSTSLDEIFYLIQKTFCKEEVNKKIAEILSKKDTTEQPLRHKHIATISSNKEGFPQIVTTNFDIFFEKAIPNLMLSPQDRRPRINVPPFLPDLSQHSPISGITYLHGRISDETCNNAIEEKHLNKFILSSADLGRAYLSEGWAANFVRYIFSNYTVVLIGYRAEDPPIHYLLMGMNDDGNLDQSNLYAFDHSNEDQEEVQFKWHAKGVTPIMYSSHEILWETIEEWADRSSSPIKWRNHVTQNLSTDPKLLDSYERGQIAYLMRTADGIKKLKDPSASIHPAWINVFDGEIRLKERYKQSSVKKDDTLSQLIYGLDGEDYMKTDKDSGDIFNITDIVTKSDNSSKCAVSNQIDEIKERNMIYWITNNMDSPVMALWAVRQDGLSRNLLQSLRRKLRRHSNLDKKSQQVWKLILNFHEQKEDFISLETWRDFARSVSINGWTKSSLREFSKLTTPAFMCRPKSNATNLLFDVTDWSEVSAGDIIEAEVMFPKFDDRNIDVPDKVIRQSIMILQNNLLQASMMISEIDSLFENITHTPTCYQDREVYGDIKSQNFSFEISRFIELLERAVTVNPSFVRSLVNNWPLDDCYFFRKFKLFMLNKDLVFSGKEAVSYVTTLTRDEFWYENCERELMYLIADRRDEFNMFDRKNIADRILESPVDLEKSSTPEKRQYANMRSAMRGSWLMKQNFIFSKKFIREVECIIQSIDGWESRTSEKYLAEYATIYTRGWVHKNHKLMDNSSEPDVTESENIKSKSFLNLIKEINMTSFSDVVRQDPRLVMLAFEEEGSHGSYPTRYWKEFIRELAINIDFLPATNVTNYLLTIPDVIIGSIGFEICEYLKSNCEALFSTNEMLAWKLIDRCIHVWARGYFVSGKHYTDLDFVFAHSHGKDIRHSSNDYSSGSNIDASSHPVGMITGMLVKKYIASESDDRANEIKLRLGRLLEKSNRNHHFCVTVLGENIDRLYQRDQGWVKFGLVSLFEFTEASAESAWAGFLNDGNSSDSFILEMSNLIVNLFPWASRRSWDKVYTSRCVTLVIDLAMLLSKENNFSYQDDVRECLRCMNGVARNDSILYLSEIGQQSDKLWVDIVIPFLTSMWPKDLKFRTQSATLCWLHMLANADRNFDKVYNITKNYLVPIVDGFIELTPFILEENNQASLASRFPGDVLDLVNSIIPLDCYEEVELLDVTLRKISSSDSDLVSDSRYVRLLNIVE